jgi:hypothetical protein
MQKRYPFKFLDAYTLNDSAFYFGRDEEIAAMYEMVFQTDLLLVYGGSGTGKTSLIQCGLAAKFQTHEWLSLFIRRGNNINKSLEKALMEAGGNVADGDDDLEWLNQDWTQEAKAKPQNNSELAKRFKAIYLSNFKPIYLIFDQFEELFILGNKEEQDVFFETVKEILRLEQPIKIIISIREEYLGYLYEFERKVPHLLRKKLRVEPMNFDKVKEVIKGVGKNPESLVALKEGEEEQIAAGVFAKIKGNERRVSIELPYLQVFLDKLYITCTGDESRTSEIRFSLAILETMGNIGDVLRDLLDDQVQLTAENLALKPEFIWQVLSPFVTLDGTKEPLSHEMLCSRLLNADPLVISQILLAFVNRRILRYAENEELYEIAHDSLAKQIHAKRSDEDIALLEVQRLVKSQALIKEASREYFTERQLQLIEPCLDKYIPGEAELHWIEQSRRHIEAQKAVEKQKHEEELIQARKRLRKTRMLLTLALIALLIAVWQFYDANLAKKKAIEQEEVANQKSIEAENALLGFKTEQAKKLRIEFDNLVKRTDVIRRGDVVIPAKIINEMDSIARMHPDSIEMFKIINQIKQ